MALQLLAPLILTRPGRKGRITSPVGNKETEALGPTEAAVQAPRSGQIQACPSPVPSPHISLSPSLPARP